MSQPGRIELNCGAYSVVVVDAGWGTDPTRYPRVHQVGAHKDYASSWHSVTVTRDEEDVATCLLIAGGGASGVHDHSAVCIGDRCYVAVGEALCALSIPTLALVWDAAVDSATCFGVYHVPEHDCLISHGELEIARVDFAGKVAWQTSGRDIFTEGFVIRVPFIEATDWDKTTYRIEIETGQIVAEVRAEMM